MDTILGIPLGESYSGKRALVDLSVCVKIYQQRTNMKVVISSVNLLDQLI